MQLYRIQKGILSKVNSANPAAAGVKETSDLESWIRQEADIFDRENILWISRQERTGPSDRADLLGMCADEILLVELKRDVVTRDAVSQALSYLAPHARDTREDVLNNFIEQAAKTGEWALLSAPLDPEQAREKFEKHEPQEGTINQFQTIVLVGTDFTPETLQICGYLNECIGKQGVLTIECWRLFLFQSGEDYLCSFDKILPSKDVEVEIEERRDAILGTKYKRDQRRIEMMKSYKARCSALGLSAKSSRGQSYECNIPTGDDHRVYFTIYQNEDPKIWAPVKSSKLDQIVASAWELDPHEPDYRVMSFPFEAFDSASRSEDIAAKATDVTRQLYSL